MREKTVSHGQGITNHVTNYNTFVNKTVFHGQGTHHGVITDLLIFSSKY